MSRLRLTALLPERWSLATEWTQMKSDAMKRLEKGWMSVSWLRLRSVSWWML